MRVAKTTRTIIGVVIGVILFDIAGMTVFKNSFYPYTAELVQWEHGIYDDELSYIFKSNDTFNFKGSEYTTNSLGLRDDEESLYKPDVIVLGDSFAFGWGVEQNQTFSALLESEGLKVLNAGVSSYGTVRELKLLERLDLSNNPTIIIQYTSNDITENEAYAYKGFRIMSRLEWEKTVMFYKFGRWYYPGKYSVLLLRMVENVAHSFLRREGNHSFYFDNVTDGVSLVVVDVDGVLGESVHEVVDVSDVSRIEVDGHFTVAAHREVAERLRRYVS